MSPREARIVLKAEVWSSGTFRKVHKELRDRRIIPSLEGSKGNRVHRQEECMCEGKDQYIQSRGLGQDGNPGSLKSRWNQRLVETDWWSPQCKRKNLYTHQKCLAVRALLRPPLRAVTCSVWVLCLPPAPSGYGLSVRSSSSQCAGKDTQRGNSLSFKWRHRWRQSCLATLWRRWDTQVQFHYQQVQANALITGSC